ncbi:MAG: hypothetical protein B6I34_03010 [Anaerolineaceae bacterium 4572_32.1]|nr:MAG: hypothetical protein B6I34_03010 [Anaerolineaceae bacterium 4572_32.1]
MLQTLRTRVQIERLITAAILTSVPISFYGILQHYGLDPLPWIGNVQARVASNMGNAIFVSAYLIMIAPLTWARAFDAFAALLLEEEGSTVDVIRGAVYVFVAALQAITIYWSRSRGPLLGFVAGALFFLLVLAFVRRWRWLIWGAVTCGLVVTAFLIVFNIPGGPLEPLKDDPYLGRLGRVFETESGTGKVRVLIWEGAIDLVLPHEPLEYPPDGSPDALNFARPLIGYGPEAMWVAYNRFYPPDLAHYEARNASPDRSHNETFDSLVITGLAGFGVYMLVFASVFYYGFKWLGLLQGKRERNLFITLWIVGGTVGAVVAGLLQKEFIGVGLPLGIIAGVGLYLVAVTTFVRKEIEAPQDRWHQLLLIALISALVAHFVEIHFGIAIAATRLYFWIYAALLVVVGYGARGQAFPVQVAAALPGARRSRRKRRRDKRSQQTEKPAWLGPALVYGFVVSFLLMVLVYDFVTNQARETSIGDVIWHSLTTKLIKGQMVPTFGVTSMFVLVWFLGGVLAVAEMFKSDLFKGESRNAWAKAFLLYLPIPPVIALLYAALHVDALRQPLVRQGLNVIQASDLVAGVLVLFYVMAFLLLLALALLLYWQDRSPKPFRAARGVYSLAHPIIILVVILVIWLTNVNVIRADIIFKQGSPYEQGKHWAAAVEVYKHALDVAPHEDFYYLYLGRAYLELSKDSQLQAAQKLAVLEECRNALQEAQKLNPLNTDHSANLARLYSSWAVLTKDPDERAARIEQAFKYYEQATSLSPHNAQLFNEWGQVYMTAGHFDKALEKLEQSLALDQEFDMTYFALADLYYNSKQLELAAEMYEKGLALNPQVTRAWSFLGVIYAQLGRYEEAIEANLHVLDRQPENFDALKNLTLLYRDTEQLDQALIYAQRAAQVRPDYAPMQQLLGELYRALQDESGAEKAFLQALEQDPQDVNSLWGLAMIYWDQGRLEEAIAQLETARQAAPDNIQVRQALGDLYIRTAQWQKAIEAYMVVLEAQPDQTKVRSALAHAYAQAGQLEDAVAQTLLVLEANPDDFINHKNLALLYRDLGRIDEALTEAKKALELAPQNEQEAISDFIAELEQILQGS